MKRQVGLLSVVFSVAICTFAAAQTNDISACRNSVVDPDPNLVVKACTAVIEEPSETTGKLALVFSARGNAYYDKGLSDLAIQDFDQAIKLDPDYAEAFYDRGSAYFQKGNYDRALQEYNEAIRLKPDYTEAYNNRANVYYQKGDMDRAIQDLDRAISLDPRQSTATFNRGLVNFLKGDCSRAMQDFISAKSLNPQYDIPDSAVAVCTVSN